MDFINQAIELAKKGSGHTSPNPLVGAVLVKNGAMVGRGYHCKAGTDHAEIVALQQAGQRARGATLYVNLEPCCHQGRTGPCSRALIAAGIKAVHLAMPDPNPRVRGRGKRELEAAGIRVIVGEYREAAERLNEIFTKYITTRQPFVLAKWAMSLDGALTVRPGQRPWISSAASRQRAHQLRQQYDAILVGVNTVIADNPSLTVRYGISHPAHPLRVIVDSIGRTPLDARVLSRRLPGKTLIATTTQMNKKKIRLYEKKGADVLVVNRGSRVNLKILRRRLGERGITSVLIEGGSTVLQSALRENVVDKVQVFLAPKVIGSPRSARLVSDESEQAGVAGGTSAGGRLVSLSNRFTITDAEAIAGDVLITAYPAARALAA